MFKKLKKIDTLLYSVFFLKIIETIKLPINIIFLSKNIFLTAISLELKKQFSKIQPNHSSFIK